MAFAESATLNGDRSPESLTQKVSVAKKLTFLFMLVVAALLALFVGWKFFSGQAERRRTAEDASTKPAASASLKVEQSLPPITITKPPPAPAPEPPAPPAPPIPIAPSQTFSPPPPPPAPMGKKEPTEAELILQRKMSSPVAMNLQQQGQGQGSPSMGGNLDARQTSSDDSLGRELVSTATPKATARSLGDLNFLITKGTFIEAVMETAMSSDQPGMLKALVTTDVYGANGKVVLLERGTRLVGEFKGQLRNGQARVFCLWTRAETPKGIIINLDSGAADALGRSGLDGDIDHHWTLRLGTAMLLSTWSDTLQALMAIQRQGGDNTYYNFDSSSRTSQDLATEALKPYINIPPTLLKNHGEPVRVFVARDLDFRNVYQLGITDQPGIQFVSAPLPATFDPPAPLAPQTRPSASPESSADSVVLSPGQSARQNAR